MYLFLDKAIQGGLSALREQLETDVYSTGSIKQKNDCTDRGLKTYEELKRALASTKDLEEGWTALTCRACGYLVEHCPTKDFKDKNACPECQCTHLKRSDDEKVATIRTIEAGIL